MYIRKFLQRRDAVSLIVAVVLAMILLNFLTEFVYQPSVQIVELLGGREDFIGYGGTETPWQELYLFPFVKAVLQVAVLEVALRLLVPVRSALVRKK